MEMHNETLLARQRFVNTCGPDALIPPHVGYYTNFPTTYAVIILAYALAVALFYLFILVSLCRLANSIPTFIIFLSHGINDTAVLFTGNYIILEDLLGVTFFTPCQRTERIIVNCLFFSTFLHLLLIAINWGISMHFPVAYTWIWTRRTCLLSIAVCWALTAFCNAIVIADWIINKDLKMKAVLLEVFVGSLYASLAIYASVIFRKALERVCWCRGGRVEEEGQQLPSSSSLEEKARVRLFIYAFATSIPILIYQYAIPLLKGNIDRFIRHLDLISISLLSSALLFAMSRQVRENTPWLGKLYSASATITPVNTTSAAAATIHHDRHEENRVGE